MFVAAVAVVVLASYRSLELDQLFKKNSELEELSLQGKTALMIPIVGSIGLLLFFYYFSVISFLSTIAACITSSFGIVFAIYPVFARMFRQLATREVNIPGVGVVPVLCILLYPISVILIITWLFTGHWILNNVIGISLCIVAICFMRIPGLKVAAIVLGCLFLYDIFWVFYSADLFGENVMVSVATKAADNPAATIAKTLNLSTKHIAPTLQLPMKLIWGHYILGLGDMVVPGLLISYTCRFDKFKGTPLLNGYFGCSVVGYAFGLLLSMIFAFVYDMAQPALLYLVPCTLLPISVLGFVRGQFQELWQGLEDTDTSSKDHD